MFKFEKKFFLSMALIFIKLISSQAGVLADSNKQSSDSIQETQQEKDEQNTVQPAIYKEVTERDLLIFSLLSYHNPVKILGDEQKGENDNKGEQHFYTSEFLKKLKETSKFELFAGHYIDENELQGWELIVNCEFEDFYAQFWGKNKCLVVVFRGTAADVTWRENLKYLLFSPIVPHKQVQLAKKCARALFDQPEINKKYDTVIFTGHSLGGLLATYASVEFANLTNEFVDKLSDFDKKAADCFRKKIGLFTFNGLGCSRSLRDKVKKHFLGGIRALNFRIEDDGVSKIGYHLGRMHSFHYERKNDTPHGRLYYAAAGSHSLYHFFSIKRFMPPDPEDSEESK